MHIGFMASEPNIEVPGDIYVGELPPKPRVFFKAMNESFNVPLAEWQNNLSKRGGEYELRPGMSGIMARCGRLMGVNKDYAVWQYGFGKGSPFAEAFGCHYPGAILWVLTRRRSGKIIEQWDGYATELPANFRAVIDGPAICRTAGGHFQTIEFYAPSTHTVINPSASMSRN